MHFEFEFLDIIFRFTIFSLLAYKLVSFARQYLIPYLHKEIKTEQDTRLNLIEKDNILISSQHKVETQIRHQQALFDLLEKNVQSWQRLLLTQKNHTEEEFNKIKISIDQKRAIQQINYSTICTSKDVLPYALKQAEIELINTYSGQPGKSSFDSLIEKLVEKKTKEDA
ncbi:MAG: hypothetical protein WCS92_00965 [Candidatus Babeliales bacterium]|jgi:hypothetical protein